MPPPPKRTITLLEAHPSNSPLLDTDANTISSDAITGPSLAPPSTRATTSLDSTPVINSYTSSRPRKSRPSSRRPHERWATSYSSDETSLTTSYSTSTEFSSTTTFYSSNSGFTTYTSTKPTMTVSGPPVRRAHAVDFDIPDPPAWFPFLIATLLIFMLCLAVLFYCVNFPPTGHTIRRWREWITSRWPQRYGYEEIADADAREIELDSNFSGSSSASPRLRAMGNAAAGGRGEGVEAAPAAAFTTSARTPALHNTPTLYSRRRKRENMSLDTGAAGLGIDLSGEAKGHLRGQKSFDDTLLRLDLDKPLPKPPLSPSSRAIQSAKAFLSTSNTHQSTAPRSRKGSTDLEAGLLKPPPAQRQCPQRTTSHSASSPPPSPGMRVLEMVGGSVEYAADKMSKFLYDQVKEDPEEGLLLPVRDCERQRITELEKVC